MRADSGEEALQAIRDVMLRGDQVAAILADYRMPRMNGVDFLEEAMDLVPQARRALLTAYADTNAAIAAINVVDVDHYLLKPWEPPEEKLYPVVDELLETWQREARPAEHKIKILGHPWSSASYEVRDFLARNLVSYRWYNVDDPDGARLLAAAGAEASQAPVVITARRRPADPTEPVRPGQCGRAEHHPAGRVLRPGDRGRRAGRSGRGGVRGLRGPEDGRGGAGRGRRSGRAELADRELPRLSRRGRRRPADRPGPAAGAPVRRRAAHRAQRQWAEGHRRGPGGGVRRRHRGPVPRRGAGHRGQLPPARGLRGRRPGRPRRLLRLGVHPGRILRGRPRDHRRRGQLGRAGRGLLRPARGPGDHGGPRGQPGAVDVVLSDRADRGHRQHRRPAEHLGAEVRRPRPPAVRHPGRPRRRPAGGGRRVTCSSSSARPR